MGGELIAHTSISVISTENHEKALTHLKFI